MSKKSYFLFQNNQQVINTNIMLEDLTMLTEKNFFFLSDRIINKKLLPDDYLHADSRLLITKSIIQGNKPDAIKLDEYFLNRLSIDVDDDLDFFTKDKIICEFYMEYYKLESEFLFGLEDFD